MKNLKKSLFILFSLFFALGITPITKVLAEGTEAISNPNPNISVTRAYTGDVTPFKTNYGNGGYTKIELYGTGISGVAYGPGGIQISIPTID